MRKLEEIIQLITNEEYNLVLYLSSDLVLRIGRQSFASPARNELLIKQDSKTYCVPLSIGKPLEFLYGLLADGPETWTKDFELNTKNIETTAEQKSAMLKAYIGAYEEYLQILCMILTPRNREFVIERINAAACNESERITKYGELIHGVEHVEEFKDITPRLKILGFFKNLFSLGGLRKDVNNDITNYAARNIAWNVISRTSEEASRVLESDSKYVAGKNATLSAQLKEIASFYGNISIFASQGSKRMEKWLERYTHLFRRAVRIYDPDVKGISCELAEHLLSYKFRFEI